MCLIRLLCPEITWALPSLNGYKEGVLIPQGVLAPRLRHLECNVRRLFLEATLCMVVPFNRVKTQKIGWSQPRVKLQIQCLMYLAVL